MKKIMISEFAKLGSTIKIWIYNNKRKAVAIAWFVYDQRLKRYRLSEFKCFENYPTCRKLYDIVFELIRKI